MKNLSSTRSKVPNWPVRVSSLMTLFEASTLAISEVIAFIGICSGTVVTFAESIPAAPESAAAGGTACTDDGNVCTNDICNGSGSCTHPSNTASCDDGNACTVMDRVVRGTCTGDPVICPAAGDGRAGRCDPAAGCVYGPNGESHVTLPVTLPATLLRTTAVPEEVRPVGGSTCDDGNACTTSDMFRDGACRGEPFLCTDGNDMTADSCDPRSGCVFTQLEQVPATTVMTEPQGRIITPAPVFVPVTVTAEQEPCPAGCSCLTRDEAVARFGRFLPCSDRPCGSLESSSGPVLRYCLRPAA